MEGTLRKRFSLLFAGVLAVAVVAAGCGGSDDNGSSTASLSKAQFIEQGNAICSKGNAKLESEFEEFAEEHNLQENKKPSDSELEEATETILIPGISSQVEEIRALGTPEGDEGEVDEILTGAEEAVEDAEEDPVSFAESESPKLKEVNKQAREYGLTVCGEEESE
jgi:hypothetical protein